MMVLKQDSAHEIYPAETVHDQSSHGDKIITFKPKMQKIRANKVVTKTTHAGTK